MKKTFVALISLMVISSLLLTGCVINSIQGTGPIQDSTFDFKDFTEVEISNSFEYEITRADTYSVTVSTHENIIQYLDVTQSGNRVRIGLKSGRYTNSELKATITMPQLNKLAASGATRGSTKGFKSTNNLEIDITGASQLDMEIEAGNTDIAVSGASQMRGSLVAQETRIEISGASRGEITGSATTADINVSGASRFPSPDFQMQNTNIVVSGASNADITTSGDLDIEASGASSLNYSGDPSIKDIDVSGASRVNKR